MLVGLLAGVYVCWLVGQPVCMYDCDGVCVWCGVCVCAGVHV